MLAKLRRRFIIITMSLVGAVLLVVLAVSLVSDYQVSMNRINDAIENSLRRGPGNSFIPWIGNTGTERYSDSTLEPPQITEDGEGSFGNSRFPIEGAFVPVYVIGINTYTNEIIIDNSDSVGIDSEILSTALNRITEKLVGSSLDSGISISGHLVDLQLMYKAEVSSDGYVQIAIASVSSVAAESLRNLGVSALIWIGAMLLFFFISLFLSKIVLRPVAEAWEKQRQFISDASHELKTPLTVILANNSLLQANPDKTIKEQMHWLDNTQAEAERMDDLVRNLLLLAQTDEEERTEMANAKSTVNLSALVEQNLLQFETVLFERGIELNSDISEGIQVLGRDDQLSRLLHILLDNASKYASAMPVMNDSIKDAPAIDEHGEANTRAVYKASVYVSLKPTTPGKSSKASKHSAALVVANSGEPIDPASLPHIFDRFYRGDKAHSATDGAGLGLSLAKAIVAAHSGEITAQSDAVNGTVFTVLL